jgi:hypothetical protein
MGRKVVRQQLERLREFEAASSDINALAGELSTEPTGETLTWRA